jgi:hypothetical protein
VAVVQRFILEIGRDEDDRVCGHVASDGGSSVPFSGWLELLRLLEDLADDTTYLSEGAGQ